MRDLAYYILDGRDVRKVDRETCYRWQERDVNRNLVRRIAEDEVGQFWVSTVFLTLDHSYGDGPPIVFETMVFRRGDDGQLDMSGAHTERCSTYDEAEKMHRRVVEGVRSGEIPEVYTDD